MRITQAPPGTMPPEIGAKQTVTGHPFFDGITPAGARQTPLSELRIADCGFKVKRQMARFAPVGDSDLWVLVFQSAIRN
jgi:hypothetical protein